jgi:hypothetical protein
MSRVTWKTIQLEIKSDIIPVPTGNIKSPIKLKTSVPH